MQAVTLHSSREFNGERNVVHNSSGQQRVVSNCSSMGCQWTCHQSAQALGTSSES